MLRRRSQTLFVSLRFWVFVMALCLSGVSPAQEATFHPVRAEVLAETTAWLRGGETTVVLQLTAAPGWYTYWRNPGDTGTATSIQWQLPEGVRAGPIQWPTPEWKTQAKLVNFGHSGVVRLPVPISLDDSWAAGGSFTLVGEARWLACREVCIPGRQSVQLTLPVADSADLDPSTEPVFESARAALPVPMPEDWHAAFAVSATDVTLEIATRDDLSAAQLRWFPAAADTFSYQDPQRRRIHPGADGSLLRLSQQRSAALNTPPERIEGVLQIRPPTGPSRNYAIAASPATTELIAVARDELPPVAADGVTRINREAADALAASVNPAVQIATALLFALFGGFLLNLMPCVFPVLSIKAMALMRSAEADAREQRRQALAYTAGAVLSCVAAASVLLALRAGGEALGWGFQLQSPIFVAAMIYLLMLLGLSMSGVLELGSGLMGTGSGLAQRPGLSGAFFTGVLAVIVASPCTAPFMGTALGFAITQPLMIALSVFAALGIGLALPFLLLGFYPQLGRWLPRPGVWMLRFKQAMAFPIYLTCVWLTWVLIRQTGASAFLVVAIGSVVLAMGAWLWGLQPRSRTATTFALCAFAATAASLALPMLRSGSDHPPPNTAAATAADGIERAVWSPELLAQLRSEGRTVFVNFTADWCITCKVNERGALQADSVLAAMRQHRVVWLTGDWTRANPQITEELAKFARNGVPLYLVYGRSQNPDVLPQVLTPASMTSALRAAADL